MSNTAFLEELELPDDCKEISHKDFLSSFLTDEGLTDLSLQGNDGVIVRASRLVLSARSKVFRSMFLGKFSEANKETIILDYKGCVLKAIVEYILTDSAEMVSAEEIDGTTMQDEDDFGQAETLVSLMVAALYFELPGLCKKTFRFIAKLLGKKPAFSFVVLEVCQRQGPAVPKQLKNLATSFLCSNIESMDMDKVALLGASTLEEILKNDKAQADEYHLFKLVHAWVEKREEMSSNAVEAEDTQLEPSDIILAAREMVKKHIHLEWIEPSLLSTSVASSNLVSQELLLEAFKLQALAAENQHNVVFKRPRYSLPEPSVWSNSKSDTTSRRDLLEYPPMKSGVHRWTIEVINLLVDTSRRAVWVGIASASKPVNLSTWLGGQEGAWVYNSIGSAVHNSSIGESAHPRFQEGSKVTLTLDLRVNRGHNGALTASVDGGDSFTLFENMRDHLEEVNGKRGFVPAVSLMDPSKIRLLSIERVE